MNHPYDAYNNALEEHRARISELNEELNTNRAQYAETLAKRDSHTLAGHTAKAKQAQTHLADLDLSYEWLQRDIELLGGRGGVRHNPHVITAAKAVMLENAKEMQTLQHRWEHVAGNLKEHKRAFMVLVGELGKIEQRALSLRAQLNDITDNTGLTGTWLSTPGSRAVNLLKNTGLIFMDPKEAAERFKWPDKYQDKE